MKILLLTFPVSTNTLYSPASNNTRVATQRHRSTVRTAGLCRSDTQPACAHPVLTPVMHLCPAGPGQQRVLDREEQRQWSGLKPQLP